MGEDERNPKAEAAGTLAVAVAGTVIPAVTIPSALGATVVSALVLALGQIVMTRLGERNRRRADNYWEAWKDLLHDDTRTAERLAAWAQEHQEDHLTTEAVMRTIRGALDAPDEAAVPFFAHLAKEYVGGSKPMDRYFRGMCAMLSECDEQDLHALRTIVDAAHQVVEDSHIDVVQITLGDRPDHVFVEARRSLATGGSWRTKERVPTEDGERFMHLAGLAGVFSFVAINGRGWRASPEILGRIRSLLAVTQPAPNP